MDGGFVTRKLREKLGKAPEASDIIALADEIRAHAELSSYELMRIYYYDAPPALDTIEYPVSKTEYVLATTERARQAQSLHDQLELADRFALRMGETRMTPFMWKIKPAKVPNLIKTPRELTDADFMLDMNQKGVDIRIGLDMARLALRDMVRAVAVVTGDSDFVPAFKFVRREGVKVMLCTLGHKGARRVLKAHSDFVLS